MIAVIFEVLPKAAKSGDYFCLAAKLQGELERSPGFITVERFESVTQPGKFLSLSFWRDEDSVRHWRTRDAHRQAQRTGRDSIFEDYRLRVASVLRDYSKNDRRQAPAVRGNR